MNLYGVQDVEKVLRVSRSTIRSLVRRGFVCPARGPRREYRFSFQDLIVMRTARALVQANVPRHRINRSLSELRRHLPEVMPLSGLNICAIGEQVVVRDGTLTWHADSGQYLLDLDVSLSEGTLHMVERKPAEPSAIESAEDWFLRALQLEESDRTAACAAYEKCLAIDPDYLAARINCGRLLHQAGRLAEAERMYTSAREADSADATLQYNLGVLLEDMRRPQQAIEAYLRAVSADPELADAHYNLARLFEMTGQPQHAIRHLSCYRKLSTV